VFLSGQLVLARYLLFNFVFWFWSCILSFHLVLSIVLTCYFGFQSDLFVLILHFDLLVWLLENFDFKNIFLNRVGLAVVLLLALLLCFYFFTICFWSRNQEFWFGKGLVTTATSMLSICTASLYSFSNCCTTRSEVSAIEERRYSWQKQVEKKDLCDWPLPWKWLIQAWRIYMFKLSYCNIKLWPLYIVWRWEEDKERDSNLEQDKERKRDTKREIWNIRKNKKGSL